MKRKILLYSAVLCSFIAGAQNYDNIAYPYLLFDGNARVAAMGQIASVSDTLYYNGTYQNPALLSRRVKSLGINYSKTDYPKSVYIGSKKSYHSLLALFSINTANAFSISYCSLNVDDKEIYFIHENEVFTTEVKDRRIDILKLNYAHHFKNGLSFGSSIKYLYDWYSYDLAETQSFMFDLGINYDGHLWRSLKSKANYSIGTSLSNIGGKAKYKYVKLEEERFLPANFSLGVALFPVFVIHNDFNLRLTIAHETNKLLLSDYASEEMLDDNISVIQSYFDSFNGDLEGLTHKFGIETNFQLYQNYSIAFRYGNSHQKSTDSKITSFGFGINFYNFYVNYYQLQNFEMNYDNTEVHFFDIGYAYIFK